MLQILITLALLILVGTLAIINNGHLTTAGYVASGALAAWVLFLIVRALYNQFRKPKL